MYSFVSFTWRNVLKLHPCFHVGTCISVHSFLLIAELCCMLRTLPTLLIQSPAEGYLDSLRLGLFQIMPLGTLTFKPSCRYMFSFLLGRYLQVNLLGYIVDIYLIFKKLPNVFLSGHTIFQPHQQFMRSPVSPHPHQHRLLSVFSIIATLVGVNDIKFWGFF